MTNTTANRPRAITAETFVREGYKKLIEDGKCEARYYGRLVRNLTPYDHRFHVWPADDGVSGLIDPDEAMLITWLQPAAAESVISLSPAAEAQLTKMGKAAANAGGQGAAGDRDVYLRNDLFKRVKDTLDLTLAYLPGELAEFPEKVQTVVSDFGNYCNLAEKQIQKRDIEIARLQTALAEAQARADGLREALEYYANKDLYLAVVTTYKTGEYDLDCSLLYEGGEIARKALEAPTTGGSGEG